MNEEQHTYKVRDLKVYASTEWLADNRKKYRQVFDKNQTSYIYAELSFYNKLFDAEDWQADIELHCFLLKKGRKEICKISFERTVGKHEHIMYVREGWGHSKAGAFWKKGRYVWEAFVNGNKVASKMFYVEDAGRAPDALPEGENPYVALESLRLYEAPYEDITEGERTYYRRFKADSTRYVFVEITLRNLMDTRPWHCELFAKFFNSARELKGQIVRLQEIEQNEEHIQISVGWGSSTPGTWREGRYMLDVVFMEQVLASVPFEIGDDFEEGTPSVLLPQQQAPTLLVPAELDTLSFEELLKELDALVGLTELKKKVREHATYIRFLQLRKAKGFKEKDAINVHSVFIGNPGTGKTTVAKMMGRLYRTMGLLSKGHVHEVDRVDLVGEYIGQTAPKVREAIEKARGGVLFIDEAYALARSMEDSRDFGREVIEILVKEMSNGPGDLAVIVAGYPEEMKKFLDSNPGLRSRFSMYFEFTDYLPQELSRIAEFACEQKKVRMTNEAKTYLDELIIEGFRNRDRTFGNARFVFNLVEKTKFNLGLRVMAVPHPEALGKDDISVIQLDDVKPISIKDIKELPYIPVDVSLLEEALGELDALIGMNNIKAQIHELVRLVRFYRDIGRDVLNRFFLHTVFVGNPGTGKTTVARILTKIYKALGMLERGHMVETDRQGLVAGFVGQTAIKTAAKIEEALGGVLFIDEAYALTSGTGGAHGDFGNEAIQTLLKRMEDHRGQFFLFVAGYPENMDSFLKANPGLKSRFDKVLQFEDYTPEELFDIARKIIEEEGLEPTKDAQQHLRAYFSYLYDYRDKYFGNARTVRQVVSEALKQQSLRLSALPQEERRPEITRLLTYEDVKDFSIEKDAFQFTRKAIGFGRRGSG